MMVEEEGGKTVPLAIQFLLPTHRGSLPEHRARVSKESQLPTHAFTSSIPLDLYSTCFEGAASTKHMSSHSS